jgi:hypothetical protein
MRIFSRLGRGAALYLCNVHNTNYVTAAPPAASTAAEFYMYSCVFGGPGLCALGAIRELKNIQPIKNKFFHPQPERKVTDLKEQGNRLERFFFLIYCYNNLMGRHSRTFLDQGVTRLI